MHPRIEDLPWLTPGMPFPATERAWPPHTDAPGLLAAGGDLEPQTLRNAYSNGIYPWFSEGQPILWWCPSPRMVLQVAQFRLHRSLRKTLVRFKENAHCDIRFDTAFSTVIQCCANAPRQGMPGTWILPSMVQAYTALHNAGQAHSIETWVNGELVGGLYCVALGRAVYGESMFARQRDASKIALAALVAFCRAHSIALIDCQQNTAHLASMGASEMERAAFLEQMQSAQQLPHVHWRFDPIYWQHLLTT